LAILQISSAVTHQNSGKTDHYGNGGVCMPCGPL